MDVEVLTVSSYVMSSQQRAGVIALCSNVFKLDYAYYLDLVPDRMHVLGYVGQQLVTHALWLDRRMRIGQGPLLTAAYVEGVATHPDYRKRGCGSAVMQHLQREISAYDLGALSPAHEHEGWYVGLGWERWQGPLAIVEDGQMTVTPGETVMIYRTGRISRIDLTATLSAEWRPFEPW